MIANHLKNAPQQDLGNILINMASFTPSAPQQSTPPFSMLIAAAGAGERLGGDIPKQYQILAGEIVLRRTLSKFMKISGLQEIRVIIHEKHRDLYQNAVAGLNLPAPIIGAESRKKSVLNGLRALSENTAPDHIILIHDAARPLIDEQDITALLHTLENAKAATLCAPIADTLITNDEGHAGDVLERNQLRAIQTPQGFRFRTLLDAHQRFITEDRFTDDASLVSACGIDVALVMAKAPNFKITHPSDFAMAEALLSHNRRTRTGQGFDVHAFDTNNAEYVMLGGIQIPYNRKLAGHSDADVALHAITDALLGAIGAGDIGDHFPPSDMTFKDMDSAIFLEKARDLVLDKGGIIENIDLTIICEAPKIGPHKERMRTRIATILRLDEDQIGVKATTTEKLGFTGRGEGIAAQAIASVSLPR